MSNKPTPYNQSLQFTAEQLKKLEEVFPRVVLGPNASEADMRHYFGTQAVMQFIRLRTRDRGNAG